MRSPSQRDRSWSSSRTSSPSSPTRAFAPGVVEEHEREEPERLRLVGHQRDEDPPEPDRLRAQLATHERLARRRPVALVEDEVEDLEDAVEPLGQQMVRRHAVRDPGVADLPLGADQALGEGRFGDEERARDLRGLEPAERAQGQGDPRVHRQRRVAAREDQPESIVVDRHRHRPPLRFGRRQLLVDEPLATQLLRLLDQPPRSSEPVDRPVACRRRDPCPGVRRDAVARPALEGGHERVLDRLLGEIEVPDRPDERREDTARLLAEQAVDGLCADDVGAGSLIASWLSLPGRRVRGRERPDRPDLDRPAPRGRDLGGHLDRLVDVATVEQVEAAQGLLRLGERAVGHDLTSPSRTRTEVAVVVGSRASPATYWPRSRASRVKAA